MKMGIGIGWPNASAYLAGPPYKLAITNCAGDTIAYPYSSSDVFGPGIYLYEDRALTIPFFIPGTWNAFTGLPIEDGYLIDNTNGQVKTTLQSCF